MTIDSASPTPVFQQIAEHVQRLIAAGVVRSGELIPSVRTLALELCVNPNTVQRAYQTLEADGFVEARKGIGMVVRSNGAKLAKGRSQAAVFDSFNRGVQVAQAAAMSNEDIRRTFDRAMRKTKSKASNR